MILCLILFYTVIIGIIVSISAEELIKNCVIRETVKILAFSTVVTILWELML